MPDTLFNIIILSKTTLIVSNILSLLISKLIKVLNIILTIITTTLFLSSSSLIPIILLIKNTLPKFIISFISFSSIISTTFLNIIKSNISKKDLRNSFTFYN